PPRPAGLNRPSVLIPETDTRRAQLGSRSRLTRGTIEVEPDGFCDLLQAAERRVLHCDRVRIIQVYVLAGRQQPVHGDDRIVGARTGSVAGGVVSAAHAAWARLDVPVRDFFERP